MPFDGHAAIATGLDCRLREPDSVVLASFTAAAMPGNAHIPAARLHLRAQGEHAMVEAASGVAAGAIEHDVSGPSRADHGVLRIRIPRVVEGRYALNGDAKTGVTVGVLRVAIHQVGPADPDQRDRATSQRLDHTHATDSDVGILNVGSRSIRLRITTSSTGPVNVH